MVTVRGTDMSHTCPLLQEPLGVGRQMSTASTGQGECHGFRLDKWGWEIRTCKILLVSPGLLGHPGQL